MEISEGYGLILPCTGESASAKFTSLLHFNVNTVDFYLNATN